MCLLIMQNEMILVSKTNLSYYPFVRIVEANIVRNRDQ